MNALNKILSFAICLAFIVSTVATTQIASAASHKKHHHKKNYNKKSHIKRYHDLKRKHHSRRNKAGKIIGAAVAIGVLGAALADQHRYDEAYGHDSEISDKENAVGLCVHRGSRLVHKAGGDHMRLNRVNSVDVKDNARIVVKAVMTGYYDAGNKTSDVRCVVKDNRIVKFTHN